MPFDFEIDLDNMYAETWFGDAPGKRVCLRLIAPEKIDEFRKQCLTPKKEAVLNPKTRKMEFVDSSNFDSDKFTDLLTGHYFVDWDLVDVNGKAIAFTPENTKRLMNMPKFATFISECIKEMNKAIGITQEEESKNSEGSQGQ